MRPPSYYASIVKSNNSSPSSSYATNYHYDSTKPTISTTRTPSHALRSSFSSPSQSNYVSRSHLPFVAQSTLVAHCFTGVQSSTRPYGGGYSSLAPASQRHTTSTTSAAAAARRTPSSSSGYVSNSSNSSSSLSTSTSRSYLRPTSSYLSPARPSYRPIKTTSSYYPTIRLRERPLLTQISRQLQDRTSTTPTPTEPRKDSPPPTQSLSHSKLDESKAPQVNEPKPEVENDWSSDITRNISRNKYLIKFREFDKSPTPTPTSRPSIDVSATIELPAPNDHLVPVEDPHHDRRSRESVVPDREQSPPPPPTPPEKTMRLPAMPAPLLPCGLAAPEAEVSASEPRDKENVAISEPKKKRNVKLKLKPIVTNTNTKSTATVAPEVQTINRQVEVEETGSETAPKVKTKLVKKVIKTSGRDKKVKVKPVAPPIDEVRAEIEPSKSGEVKGQAVKKAKRKVVSSGELKAEPETAALKQMPTPAGAEPKTAPVRPHQEVSPLSGVSSERKLQKSVSSGRIRCRPYNYNDFNFLSVLGHGGWGFVLLAELKEHDACFAVKCIKKITIVEDDDYDSIMIERKVLTLGNLHPFICKLFCTFETEGYLFFVMEYCAGGDLMFHVQREGKFDESRCRFYASEIICAIKFLHNRHIIYRDLKLDNILLDELGHVRLVDFGMCQCRTYREEMLPSNFCGTPEYISPEIIKGVPYNHSVDWWSFGVLLYEMAVGKMPFRGQDENELLWNVCYEQIHYPMFLSKELTSLLKLLLEREPTKRMGMATCKAGDIHDQPYFRSVDWKAVEELRVAPPFVPEVSSKRDVSNFDSDFTQSACELSPVDRDTLERIDQKQFEQFPYTNPDVFIFAGQGPSSTHSK